MVVEKLNLKLHIFTGGMGGEVIRSGIRGHCHFFSVPEFQINLKYCALHLTQ